MNKRIPTSVYVFVALLLLAFGYMLTKPHGNSSDFNIQQAVKDQQLSDAERELNEARAAYQRASRASNSPTQ